MQRHFRARIVLADIGLQRLLDIVADRRLLQRSRVRRRRAIRGEVEGCGERFVTRVVQSEGEARAARNAAFKRLADEALCLGHVAEAEGFHHVRVKFPVIQQVIDGFHVADIGLEICGVPLHRWGGRCVRQGFRVIPHDD
jgi:hypothetical protein